MTAKSVITAMDASYRSLTQLLIKLGELDRAVLHRADRRSLSHHAAADGRSEAYDGCIRSRTPASPRSHESATVGSVTRVRRNPSEEQMIEYAVLDHLANARRRLCAKDAALGQQVRTSAAARQACCARSGSRAKMPLQVRDASRTVNVAVLREAGRSAGQPKLNENQQTDPGQRWPWRRTRSSRGPASARQFRAPR